MTNAVRRLPSFKHLLLLLLLLCAPERASAASADALQLDCTYNADSWDRKHSNWYRLIFDQQASTVDQTGLDGRHLHHAEISADSIKWDDDDEGGHWLINRSDLRLFFTSDVYKITWAYGCEVPAAAKTNPP
jgi:hypothetical protein